MNKKKNEVVCHTVQEARQGKTMAREQSAGLGARYFQMGMHPGAYNSLSYVTAARVDVSREQFYMGKQSPGCAR